MAQRARKRWNPFGSLTAAGSSLVEPAQIRDAIQSPPPIRVAEGAAGLDSIRARTQDWQRRILQYRNSIPEVAGAAALVRASIESVGWVVEGTGYAGGKARAQARIDATDIERIAELIWLSGESWLAVPDDPGAELGWPTPAEQVAPYSLSVEEINVHTDPITTKGPNLEQLELVDPVMRIWRASSENRWRASSPNMAAMDLLEAMYLSQRVDTATQRSRLIHAGIVFWPTNAPNIPVADGEEPVPGSRQALTAEFKHATDETVAMHGRGQEPATPFVVYYDPGNANVKYEPTMFRVERDDLTAQYAQRFETYAKRYAMAAELPLESVIGTAGTSRFGIHQIDVDKWKTWFAPLCELIRKELEAKIVKLYGPNLTLRADPTKLIAKPDQTDVVMKLAQLQIAKPDSIKAALEASDITLLEMQDPPQKDYTSNAAPGQPSDFGQGDTNRGGGKYRGPA